MANYYTQDTIKKFSEALQAARADIRSGKPVKLSISSGTEKMGAVPSVSLLPFITCPGRCTGSCSRECYAAKIANLRKSVLEAYARNTALVMDRPEIFWAGVNAAMAGTRFFRFHVSGDIVNGEYFENLVNACRNNPHCETLVFTKRYEIVNAWMKKNGALPENLHLLLSGWENLKPINPHKLPETNVFGKEGPRDDWKVCGGNCFECGCRGVGCWQAKNGETIAFKKH